MVSGAIEILTIYSSTWIIKYARSLVAKRVFPTLTPDRKVPNCRAIVGALYFVPNIVSGILMVTLPWTSKGGLLAGVYLGGLGKCSYYCSPQLVSYEQAFREVALIHAGTPGFVLSLSWCAATNLGHTKKTTW
jgi:hypothetical protein